MNAIVYDGDCPFCTNYVRLLRLRDSVGPVELINARENTALAQELATKGCDLDEGMALLLDGKIFHGADSIERIALMSTPSGVFNRVNRFIFSHRLLARSLYPALRAGRNAYLALAGIERIEGKASKSIDR